MDLPSGLLCFRASIGRAGPTADDNPGRLAELCYKQGSVPAGLAADLRASTGIRVTIANRGEPRALTDAVLKPAIFGNPSLRLTGRDCCSTSGRLLRPSPAAQ